MQIYKNPVYCSKKRIFVTRITQEKISMKYIAIIPARYASTRFPGKPLAEIAGKPMIQHVYERVNGVFEHCCVATDDERILQVVRDFGGKVVMTSDSHRSGTDRCKEALEVYEKETGLVFDVVVNVQGDEPFISNEHLDSVKSAFDDRDAEIATLACPFGLNGDVFNPNSPKVVLTASGYALYFSRSPIPFIRGVEQNEWAIIHSFLKHIGVYGYRANVLRKITQLPQGALEKAESLEQLRWLENGYKIKVKLVSQETIGVDTPEDLQRLLDKMR